MIGFHVPIEIGKINIKIINRRQKYLEKNWKYWHSKSNPDHFRINSGSRSKLQKYRENQSTLKTQ